MAAKILECKLQNVLDEMWQEACDSGKNLSFKIISGSMSPMLEVGDVVRVKRAEPTRVRVGDVVAFKEGQSVVVHRVIGRISANGQLTFRHMGDAGLFSGTIVAQNLIGKVFVIEKEGRKISLDSRRHILSNRILGWRLLLVDILGRRQPGLLSTILHQSLRPIWRLCRSVLLCRL